MSTGGNDDAGRERKFIRIRRIIRQAQSSEVHARRTRVVEFDNVRERAFVRF